MKRLSLGMLLWLGVCLNSYAGTKTQAGFSECVRGFLDMATTSRWRTPWLGTYRALPLRTKKRFLKHLILAPNAIKHGVLSESFFELLHGENLYQNR